MTTKEKLFKLSQEYVAKRIESTRQAISEAQQSANAETRSSSGDKYETGRAMAQLEIEKNSQQLSEALTLKEALEHIRIDNKPSTVQAGSLVVTDRGTFFIAISIGQVVLEDRTYIVIAPAAPLAMAFKGAKVGDRVIFRQETYLIRELI